MNPVESITKRWIPVTFALCYLVYLLVYNYRPDNHGFKDRNRRYYTSVYKYVNGNAYFDFEATRDKWLKYQPNCTLPTRVDPFQKLAMIYKTNLTYSCPINEQFTFLDNNGSLRVIPSLASDVTCYFTLMWRNGDNYITYGREEVIPGEGVQLNTINNLVNVSCYRQEEDGRDYEDAINSTKQPEFVKVYKNTHHWVPNFPATGKRGVPSVLVLFIESMSQLSYYRLMIKTQEAIKRLGHFTHLKGFAKASDNSFPNSMSLLTGKLIEFPEEKWLKKQGFWDNRLDYVWKDFKKQGFVTGFLEDMAQMGLFNYQTIGFDEAPTDWYPRTFWVQMYPETGDFKISPIMNNLTYYCFDNNGPKLDIFINQTKQFMTKMWKKQQPYFLFAFHSQVTHEDPNNLQYVDSSFASFFDDIKPLIDNTVIVFGGDHGPRYSGMVWSTMGRIEERMNSVTIRVPPQLNAKWPHLRKFIEANNERLVTWFDVHLMLLDIAHDHYQPLGFMKSKKGPVSLWREFIPPDRSCADINIPDMYCCCNGKIGLDPEGTGRAWEVNAAAAVLVTYANRLITDFVERGQCVTQKLNHTVSAQYVIPEDKPDMMVARILVQVMVIPANQVIEGNLIEDRNVKKTRDKWFINYEMNENEKAAHDEAIVSQICWKKS